MHRIIQEQVQNNEMTDDNDNACPFMNVTYLTDKKDKMNGARTCRVGGEIVTVNCLDAISD